MSSTRAGVTRRGLLRRTFGTGVALASGAIVAACEARLGPPIAPAALALAPPETTTVRIVNPVACDAPLALAREFLLEEGFTDVQYVDVSAVTTQWLTTDAADFTGGYGSLTTARIDAGLPIMALAGIHPGCVELWVAPGISTIRDLRGKTIGVQTKDGSDPFYGFFAILLAYVGIDPQREVNFVEIGSVLRLRDAFIDGRSDAFLALAQFGPALRRNPRNTGKVIVDMTTDKPWSQYYCCQLVANRDWVRRNPVATKRVTRAVLRAVDAVTKDRARLASEYVARGFAGVVQGFSGNASAADTQIVAEVVRDLSYDWRDLDPEETLRFFALRLGDAKLIKSTPQQVIAQGSDFAYMRQLRTELKR